ncbi:MAG TPA: 50S ribosomal protein L25, partial [Caldimonas sp.]
EFLTVDLGNLIKGQTLHVNDIALGEGVRVVTHGIPNPVIASATVQAAEEEVVEVAPVVVAVPAAAPTKAKKNEKQNKK